MNSSSRPGGEPVLVAVVGDGNALDQRHDEIRPAGVGGPAIQDPGDIGVVHEGQRLPFGLETGDDLARVHARLDELQRHLAADGVRLLGHENDAKPAFADLLQELVGANDRAGTLADRLIPGGFAGHGPGQERS